MTSHGADPAMHTRGLEPPVLRHPTSAFRAPEILPPLTGGGPQ